MPQVVIELTLPSRFFSLTLMGLLLVGRHMFITSLGDFASLEVT